MLINVKMLNGSSFPIEIGEEGTVLELKQLLVDKCGWQTQDQKLIYLGRVLQDPQTCKDAMLTDGQSIHLVHKPRPIDPPQPQLHDEPDEPRLEFHNTRIEPRRTSNSIETLECLEQDVEILDEEVTVLENARGREPQNNIQMFVDQPTESDVRESYFDEIDEADISLLEEEQQQADASGVHAGGVDLNRDSIACYRHVISQALGLTARILPLADILSQTISTNRDLTPDGEGVFQTALERLNMILRDLSDLFNGLSGFSMDFQRPIHERRLTHISHRNAQRQPSVSTASVTIPMSLISVDIRNLIATQLQPQFQIPTPNGSGFYWANNLNVANPGQSPHVLQSGMRPVVNPSPGTAAAAGTSQNRPRNGQAAGGGTAFHPQRSTNGPVRASPREPSSAHPSSSRLSGPNNSPVVSVSSAVLGSFHSRFVSPMEFANEMLSFAANPKVIKFLQYIHGQFPDSECNVESSLAKDIIHQLVYQDGYSVVSLMKYAPDGVNFGPATTDLKTKLEEVVVTCLRGIKGRLVGVPYPHRNFGLEEAFNEIAPCLILDLKCFFGDDRPKIKRYIRKLLAQVFSNGSIGTKLVWEEKLMKSFKSAKSEESKYHGKIEVVSHELPTRDQVQPEDIDEDYFANIVSDTQ